MGWLDNIEKAQSGRIVAESTGVSKRSPNKRELKNIILDSKEFGNKGYIREPRAEANKFEKFLPDQETIAFFDNIDRNYGEGTFRNLLKIQYQQGNPKVNTTSGTNRSHYIPLLNKMYLEPVLNEEGVPSGNNYPNLEDYLAEAAHGAKPFFSTTVKSIINDVPNLIKSYILPGDSRKNEHKYVYSNPNTDEYETHSIIEPKLIEQVSNYDAYPGYLFPEEEAELMEKIKLESRRKPTKQNGGRLDDIAQTGNTFIPKTFYNANPVKADLMRRADSIKFMSKQPKVYLPPKETILTATPEQRAANDIIEDMSTEIGKQRYLQRAAGMGLTKEGLDAYVKSIKNKEPEPTPGLCKPGKEDAGCATSEGERARRVKREKEQTGGIIEDDLGQWAHPGKVTRINSNNITMQGVNYPVLGISDSGDIKMMYPGENYKFKGKKVTEYPMAQSGLRQEQKSLQNLDNLVNFTNYNTLQSGGWLDDLR